MLYGSPGIRVKVFLGVCVSDVMIEAPHGRGALDAGLARKDGVD